MIIILAPICLFLGFFVGWLASAIFAAAQISRSEGRMQQKVRYWQTEAAQARRVADQLARRLAAIEGFPGEDPEWGAPGNGLEP